MDSEQKGFLFGATISVILCMIIIYTSWQDHERLIENCRKLENVYSCHLIAVPDKEVNK